MQADQDGLQAPEFLNNVFRRIAQVESLEHLSLVGYIELDKIPSCVGLHISETLHILTIKTKYAFIGASSALSSLKSLEIIELPDVGVLNYHEVANQLILCQNLQEVYTGEVWTLQEIQEISRVLMVSTGRKILLAQSRQPSRLPFFGSFSNWRASLCVGSTCDALDTMSHWYSATVLDAKDDAVFIEYDGWRAMWNEWIQRDSRRLAKPQFQISRRERIGWS